MEPGIHRTVSIRNAIITPRPGSERDDDDWWGKEVAR